MIQRASAAAALQHWRGFTAKGCTSFLFRLFYNPFHPFFAVTPEYPIPGLELGRAEDGALDFKPWTWTCFECQRTRPHSPSGEQSKIAPAPPQTPAWSLAMCQLDNPARSARQAPLLHQLSY